MKRKLLMILVLFASVAIAFAQQRTVTGVVTSSEDKLPVIGASVSVKGTTQGTITDIDGRYSINVPDNAVLLFSYVGMKDQEVRATSDHINVVMEPTAIQMDEVVVTALGVKAEKKRLNFAVSSLNANDVLAGKDANFVNALQGKVAGINVTNSGGSANAGSQIIIRGISSVSGTQSNEPMFIIDGMPVTGGASKAADINPNDIENVTVLKGAAASALYGQEAANGVVMITTKSGKAGAMTVNASASVQIDNAFHTPKIQQLYGPGAQGFYKEQTGGGWGPLLGPGETVYDNVKGFLKTGIYQKYDVSASGGTDAFTAYASAGYSKNEGIVPNDYLDKIYLMIKSTFNISSTLSISAMANIVNNKSRDAVDAVPVGTSASLQAMNKVYTWPINDDITNYKNPDGSIRYRYLADRIQESPYSPLWNRYENSKVAESTRNLLMGSVNWKAFRGFELIGRINYDQTNSHTDGYNVAVYDKSLFTNDELESVDLKNFGSYAYKQSKASELRAQAIATYNIDLTDGLNLSLLAGTELKMYKGISSNLGGNEFIIPGDFFSIANVNTGSIAENVAMAHSRKRNYGFYGEIRLDYKGIAQVSVTGRNDHSSTVDPDKNSYFYPSVTGGLVFSELFKISGPVFSYGKLRGNWAKVGKDATAGLYGRKFKSFPAYPDGGFGTDPTSSIATTIMPEMTTSWEVGADLRFFDNRTKLDVAYYSTQVDDQIVSSVRVSPTSGYILVTKNEGAVRNRGLEISLDQDILRSRDFRWTANLNFSFNRGKVIGLPMDIIEMPGQEIGGIIATAYLHGSTTALVGKDYERTPDGQIICTEEGYPKINSAKGVVIGNREPDFLMGFSSNFNYKDLSVSFLFDIRKGGDVANGTGLSMFSNGMSKALETYRNRQIVIDGVVEQPDGSYIPNTKPIIFDQPTMNNYFTAVHSNFIEDGSYIRLSYVTVGYDLSRYLKKSPIKGLRLSLTGRNLFLLTKYTGSDPQVNADTSRGGTGSTGLDYFGVPSTRSFNFTINATF